MATAVAEGGIMRRPSAKTGIGSWLTTADHKRVGILYGYTAFFFFLIGGLEALLIRAQLAQPNGHVLTANEYNSLFTMHGLTMIFLVVMPLSAALFNYFVPIMIGARDVAFPRLNAFSYWVFLFGGLFLYSSFIFGGPPNGGWFGYAPLTTPQYSPGPGLTFYSLPPHPPAVLAGTWPHLLLPRPADAGHRLDRLGRQLHHHHPQPPGARHDPHAHAGFRVDDAGDLVPPALRHAGHRGGPVPAHLRPAVALALLQRGGGGRSTPLAAPVLAVRPSGGV